MCNAPALPNFPKAVHAGKAVELHALGRNLGDGAAESKWTEGGLPYAERTFHFTAEDAAASASFRFHEHPTDHSVLPTAATCTLTGVQFTFLVGGTVLIERIFSYEGIGNMAVDAVINRDLPLIQGIVLTFAILFIAINLAIDILVTFLNPRLRRG